MKNKFFKFSAMAVGAVALALAINACHDPGADVSTARPSNEVSVKPSKFLGGTSLANCKTKRNVVYNLKPGELNWVKDTVYCLCGDVRVPATKTLSIAKGTLIRGDSTSAGSLTVVRDAKISALGAANEPIVFTSSGTVGKREPQDWGGVIILGNAQINQTGAPIPAEGYPAATAPTYGSNSTANNGESSGTLQYVRIEFGGIPDPNIPNSEKNGLTLGGVGSGTVIDHVQVSSGADDAFEWFGGTVNASYLISHKNLDDDFDTDFGYQGKVQFGIAVRDPARADVSKSNGFESDNDGSGSTATPKTSARFSNFTLIGPVQCSTTGVNANHQDGLHIRRRSAIDVYNTVIAGFQRHQVFADASIVSTPAADAAVLNYNLAVRPQPIATATINEPVSPNNVWTLGTSDVAASATVCPATNSTANGLYRLSGLQSSAWTLTAVNVTPLTAVGYTSPILATGTDAIALGFSISNATTTGASTYFKGARRVADDNGWNLTSGWVNWQPETVAYENDGLY
jgi:hypothetical protein